MKAALRSTVVQSIAGSPLVSILRARKRLRQLVTVLCLHRVSDESSLTWPPLPVAVFDRLCRYWKKHYCVTTFSRLKEDRLQSKPLLILSFDDNYLDFYTNAWPLLQAHSLPANMNVVTACADGHHVIWTQRLNNAFDALWERGITQAIQLPGGSVIQPGCPASQLIAESLNTFQFLATKNAVVRDDLLNEMVAAFGITEFGTPHMNWDQLIELSRQGLEIGAHTLTHDVLTTIDDSQRVVAEIVESKQIIQQKTGQAVSVFAHPNGLYNELVNACCREAGFKYILTVDNHLLSPSSLPTNELIPRILVHHTGYAENVLNTENVFNSLKAMLK